MNETFHHTKRLLLSATASVNVMSRSESRLPRLSGTFQVVVALEGALTWVFSAPHALIAHRSVMTLFPEHFEDFSLMLDFFQKFQVEVDVEDKSISLHLDLPQPVTALNRCIRLGSHMHRDCFAIRHYF